MEPLVNRQHSVGFALLLACVGCSAPVEHDGGTSLLTPTQDSLRAQLGLPAPEVVDLGSVAPAKRDGDGAEQAAMRLVERIAELPAPREDQVALLGIDTRDGRVVSATFQRSMLGELHDELRRRGTFGADPQELLSDPTGELPADEPSVELEAEPRSGLLVDKAWSGGADNRVRHAIEDGAAADHSVYQSIGEFEYGGSGTLFSKRIALTAGHVLITKQGTFDAGNTFAPRRSLTRWPANADQMPYGQASVWFLWFDQSWYADRCFESDSPSASCRARDWMFAIFAPDPWSPGSPAPMRVARLPIGDMANRAFHRGYAICSGTLKPPGCEGFQRALWGQTSACAIGPGGQPEPGTTDEFRSIRHGCDTSNGHSGGPIYAFGWGLPFLIGHHMGVATSSTTTPNHFRPVTTALLWTMAYYADACARSSNCI